MKIEKTVSIEELKLYLIDKENYLMKDLKLVNLKLMNGFASVASKKRLMQGKQRLIGRLKEIDSMRRELFE